MFVKKVLWMVFFLPGVLADQVDYFSRTYGIMCPQHKTSTFCDHIAQLTDNTQIQTENVFVKADQNQSIPCLGANEHSLVNSLQWISLSHDKKMLEYSKNSAVVVYDDPNRIGLAKDYSMTIHPVRATDTADYICLINGRPEPDGVVQLRVIDVPDPPGRPLITSFTSRTADLSWASPSNIHFSAIKYYVIRSRVGEEGVFKDSDVQTPNNDTKFSLVDLRPYTVYSFRIIAVNGMGSSEPSEPSYYMVTLREPPEGHVTITNAKNRSSSSVYFSWLPPPRDTVFGEFLGYRISYKPRTSPEENKEIYLRDPTVTNHLLTHLEPWTQYYVSVQAFNPEGLGPNTTVLIMTDEGIPEKPQNLTVLDFTSNSILIKWVNPLKKNGVIEGYRIYYIHNNFTEVWPEKIPYDEPHITYNLTRLKPLTEYTIFVKAFTQKHEGYPSDSVQATTDISGPSPPKILNLSCQRNETIHVHIKRPEKFYNSIDYYYIYLKIGDVLYDNITISSNKTLVETKYARNNVTPDNDYIVFVQASTKSNLTNRLILGQMSSPTSIYISKNCDTLSDNYLSHATSELGAGILAGTFCATIAIIAIGFIFLIWRKCYYTPYYYLDVPQCSAGTLDWNEQPNSSVDYSGPIPISLFARHVEELQKDGNIGFSKEYETIQNDTAPESNSSAEESQHPEIKQKNRYLNIIAYDHSRVQLLPLKGQKGLSYINANYIDGFLVKRAYIATQGPMPSTFNCFWRMVWEQRVTVIVMITNLIERGRRKCDMYWPKEGSEVYGVIQVRFIKEDIMATHTIRTLGIRHLKVKGKKKTVLAERCINQYHYTNWPDHGTPDHPLPVVHFIKKTAAAAALANPNERGPVVVHCSAGVGRTGTFIVLDAMLKQIRHRAEVNIPGFLKYIRAQRNFLVQTEEQYIFIHVALVQAIEGGETDICRENFSKYVSYLQDNEKTDDETEMWKPLECQFKLVTNFVPKNYQLDSANKPQNQNKNRCALIVPVENFRVQLTPRPDGLDYINATWLPGFHNLREFIITQHPLKHTITDFWQMVWDHSATFILMISFVDNNEFETFWPTNDQVIENETFNVKQVHENKNGIYFLREFTMKSIQDDYEIPVKMLQCTNWPHQINSIADIYHLPNVVMEMNKIQNGPIIVVDRFGGTEAATFCTLVTLKKHLFYESKVNVYMYAKLYHARRPGIWISINDYLKLHLFVQTICNPPESTNLEITPDLYAVNVSTNGNIVNINNGPENTNDHVRVPPEGMEAEAAGV